MESRGVFANTCYLCYIFVMTVRMRHTSGHTKNRRSHHALDSVRTQDCPKCGTKVLAHHACKNCGTYKGREVVDVLGKLTKKEQKMKAKELAAQEGTKEAKTLDAGEMSKA